LHLYSDIRVAENYTLKPLHIDVRDLPSYSQPLPLIILPSRSMSSTLPTPLIFPKDDSTSVSCDAVSSQSTHTILIHFPRTSSWVVPSAHTVPF
jgi:hypothetical protein